GSRLTTIRSELPLKAKLHLTRIQRFDETTIGIQAVIGTEQHWVGVISQVVDSDAKQKYSMVFPPHKAFGGAKIDIEKTSFIERISRESGRTSRDWIRSRRIEVCGGKRVNGPRASNRDDWREVEVLAQPLQPLGRAQVIER